jgi:hypothetical protein
MENMSIIGIKHHPHINLKQKEHKIQNKSHIMDIFMNNIVTQNQTQISGEEDNQTHKHGKMEIMNIIGIINLLHINLRRGKHKIQNNIHIMDTFMNNIGTINQTLINGEKDKPTHKHGNMEIMNIIGIQTQMDMLGE